MFVVYTSEWVVPAIWTAELLVSRKLPIFSLKWLSEFWDLLKRIAKTTEKCNTCKLLIFTWNTKQTFQWSKSAEITCDLIWIFLCGFFALVWLPSNTVSSVAALAGNGSLVCLPKLLMGSATWCFCVLDVFPLSHTQKEASQCPSKYTVSISARFYHLLSPLLAI